MVIKCHDFEFFIATIAGLTKEGLLFKATTEHLTITLTGGY